ncbi:hypothetical protein DYBT9275_01403 [Dyadobacter sp. CECT 9275]|uniref:DUF2851 family protein n=1 Tax=Dyadobacter helix TaxID=2822344 RepID=A0A916JAH1_9BACT|nr:DUF2851 family protein [Dyadobacter sp. CECT 9275]CAG4994490.1 hypothetical protein DYBT9275_01403 [Dyadobacter sp. CECT 9275]
MNEDILSFVWRFQYFEKTSLHTDHGQLLSVRQTGLKNADAGPDFSGARIEIGGIEWAGDVEIHVNASDWNRHEHSADQAYESVILHVVWNNDVPIVRKDGTLLPTLTLNGIVRLSILHRYAQLQNAPWDIACGNQFPDADSILKFSMLDRVLLERLEKKALNVISLLEANQNDWEETTFQWIGQHFGFKLNDPAFLRLCRITPWKILRKQKDSFRIEALLFGNAGLIPDNGGDEYVTGIQREYDFQVKKYRMENQKMNSNEWKFLRLRPSGFPTIRISQFAYLLSRTEHLFSTLISARNLKDLHAILSLRQSAYWTTHFNFEKTANKKVPFMGNEAKNLLVINAVIPLLVAHARTRQEPQLLETAMAWLTEIPAENNRITRLWQTLDMKVNTAADSQGLIEWYNHYCSSHNCLDCIVGSKLIKTD